MKSEKIRCWKTNNPLYNKYHDEEWGVPVHDDRKLYEFLSLEIFQAGLTWELILNRREDFKNAFDNFEPKIVANYPSDKINKLLNNTKIIRNRLKIESSINNAIRVLEIQKEYGSFNEFIWGFVEGKSINNKFVTFADLPNNTKESVYMSKELKKRGFKFIGPTICYSFMQAVGLVNDHLLNCFRKDEIKF